MKLTTARLAQRCEQKLETLIPAHILRVTHTSTRGVKITAVIKGEVKEYHGGLSWTTCSMAIDELTRDFMETKYQPTIRGDD